MMTRTKNAALCLLSVGLGLFSSSVLAQDGRWSTSPTAISGPLGGTTSPALAIRFENLTTTTDAQIDFDYDEAIFTTLPTVSYVGPAGGACTTPLVGGTNRVIRVVTHTGAPIAAGVTNYCNVTFTLPAAGSGILQTVAIRPGSSSCVLTGAGTGNCAPAPTPTFTVGVAAGVYQSTPTPGTAVVINDVVGGGATTATLTVTNGATAGGPGLTLSAISGLSGVLSIAPAAPQTIAAGGNQAFTISCAATTAGPGTAQTLTITHNGGAPGAASPVTHSVTCNGVTGPSAPTAALGTVTNPGVGAINTTGNGTVAVNVTGAGNSVAPGDSSLGLNCTVPAGTASFAITAGGTRTINGPATVGPSTPAIGFSCVRQAAAVAATVTCTQTATPGPNPANLTAAIECPAGTTAPNPGVTPASGTAFNFVGGPSAVLSAPISFTNTGGTAAYTITGCAFSPVVAGYTVSGTFPLAVPAGGSAGVTVGCTTPASPGTALANTTLTCTSSITAPPAFAPSFPVTCRAEQLVPVPTMSAGGKAMMALLVLLVGLVGFQLYRRNV